MLKHPGALRIRQRMLDKSCEQVGLGMRFRNSIQPQAIFPQAIQHDFWQLLHL